MLQYINDEPSQDPTKMVKFITLYISDPNIACGLCGEPLSAAICIICWFFAIVDTYVALSPIHFFFPPLLELEA